MQSVAGKTYVHVDMYKTYVHVEVHVLICTKMFTVSVTSIRRPAEWRK